MELLGLRYDNLNRFDALQRAVGLALDDGKANIFFLNLDCLNKARNDRDYIAALKGASLLLPDGVGIRIATALFGGKMADNCNGSDFSPILIRELARFRLSVYFLGGKEGIAKAAATNLQIRIPNLKIAGTRHGFINASEKDSVIDEINQSGADALFVGMGAPLQEKWIVQNRSRLNPKICLGVGALFDWVSGRSPRAPIFFRKLSLEWFWRMMIEPRRMVRRYLIDDCGCLFYLARQRIAQII